MEKAGKNEDELRAFIEENVKAIRSRDGEKLMPFYAESIVSFDVVNPLQYKGADEIKSRMEQWFSSFEGDIGYELAELNITADETIAYSRSLNHVDGTTKDGKRLDMWWRSTTCYKKINGSWIITHQHNSVPFNPEDGKASLGLKP